MSAVVHQHSNTLEGTRRVAQQMAEAASSWLASLSTDQRQKATRGFPDTAERTTWYYIPIDRPGLPLVEQDPLQQRKALQLAATGLSEAGFNTAIIVMALDNVLDRRENWSRSYPGRGPNSRGRDPNLFYTIVFGEPGARAWGWRFEGHHVSLNFTILDGYVVSPTPLFFGSNPAETSILGSNSIRPLASAEDLGRELLHALDAEQRKVALLSPVAPRDIVQANAPFVEAVADPRSAAGAFGEPVDKSARGKLDEYASWDPSLGSAEDFIAAIRYTTPAKGVAAATMTSGQRDLLTAVLRQYTDRLPDAIAEHHRLSFAGSLLDHFHFAWAGGAERHQGHYYRIEGPRVLVEYDCTQDQANHIHAVWRDPSGDFGADVLAEHYREAH
jgi:hypothetical protein